jgi:hypothetical protein
MNTTEAALRQNFDAYMSAEYLSEEEKALICSVVEHGLAATAAKLGNKSALYDRVERIRRKRLTRLRKVKDKKLPKYLSEYGGEIFYTVLNEEYPCEGCSNVRECEKGKACDAFREYVAYGGWESPREPTTGAYRLIFELRSGPHMRTCAV